MMTIGLLHELFENFVILTRGFPEPLLTNQLNVWTDVTFLCAYLPLRELIFPISSGRFYLNIKKIMRRFGPHLWQATIWGGPFSNSLVLQAFFDVIFFYSTTQNYQHRENQHVIFVSTKSSCF